MSVTSVGQFRLVRCSRNAARKIQLTWTSSPYIHCMQPQCAAACWAMELLPWSPRCDVYLTTDKAADRAGSKGSASDVVERLSAVPSARRRGRSGKLCVMGGLGEDGETNNLAQTLLGRLGPGEGIDARATSVRRSDTLHEHSKSRRVEFLPTYIPDESPHWHPWSLR